MISAAAWWKSIISTVQPRRKGRADWQSACCEPFLHLSVVCVHRSR